MAKISNEPAHEILVIFASSSNEDSEETVQML